MARPGGKQGRSLKSSPYARALCARCLGSWAQTTALRACGCVLVVLQAHIYMLHKDEVCARLREMSS